MNSRARFTPSLVRKIQFRFIVCLYRFVNTLGGNKTWRVILNINTKKNSTLARMEFIDFDLVYSVFIFCFNIQIYPEKDKKNK